MSGIYLSDILSKDYEQFCTHYGESVGQHKVARAITSCRTESLGGHTYACPDCSSEMTLYNSCGNRHCPKCQNLARKEWVQARIDELLPVPYFHAVFTIPAELNPFALRNKKAFYGIMFRSVKETLQELGVTSRLLGAYIGFISVLHTWGQNLMDHPHIHCIVPAGGLSKDKTKWIPCKGFFLFPFPVMRTLFRAKVLDYFKKGLADGSIGLHGTLSEFADKSKLQTLLGTLYRKKWVIFAKQPFAGPQKVIEYLGNYTHRIAISESRIVSHGKDTVSFIYKDYADESKQKTMTLSTVEFIRRFFLHLLPSGFMRIRHYGFLSNSSRKKGLAQCAGIFSSVKKKQSKAPQKKMAWYERVKERTGIDPLLCKVCGKARLSLVAIVQPVSGSNGFNFAGT
jgi:hypothetical protein